MEVQKWKSVVIDTSNIPDEELAYFGGMEELTDYQITRPNSDRMKVKKRKMKQEKKSIKKKYKGLQPEDEPSAAENEVQEYDMPAWSDCSLHNSILQALIDLDFKAPTEIQRQTIPLSIRGNQDILGAAETGSGKTLAFGIPIINNIISIKESRNPGNDVDCNKPLYCLILTPTRELAIQIKKHLQVVCKYTDIMISVVVGGMAPEKQRRILKKRPEIVVATPGRLWEMIEEGESHVSNISSMRYLVIDEADRMVEKGHFAELTQILNLINGKSKNRKRQTFVFSATLTLVHDVPNRFILKNKKGKMQQKRKLESLINLIGMKNPQVVDITKKTAVVDTLTETQILCSNEEKDSYLYYFLLMYPGRTLVFCNSIDCVRRLRTVLEFLNCHPLPLHASMHQKQRLKNLEKFEQSSTGVLLATDVAARGLDIKGIEHVIHFQVPRTAETYVHRSGRTARAQNEGLSLVLIEPQDAVFYNRICKTLNKYQSLPNFPVDNQIFKLVKERVTLVRTIDKSEHRIKRLNAQNRWFLTNADAMDIDIEEDENLLNDLGDESERAAKCREINAMKKQLKAMLSKPIASKMLFGRYPTKSGKLISPGVYNHPKAVNVAKTKNSKKKT